MRYVFVSWLASFICTSGLLGQPTVSWSKKQLSRQAFPGATITEQVSFVVTSSASNVQLIVVPELSGFVAVLPSTFSTLAPGTTYSVNVTVHVSPLTAFPLTIQGTIRLVASSSTLAVPLPVTIQIARSAFEYIDQSMVVVDAGGAAFP